MQIHVFSFRVGKPCRGFAVPLEPAWLVGFGAPGSCSSRWLTSE